MKKSLIFLSIIVFAISVKAQHLLETQLSGPLGSGARAMGMGGAFIAVADDATATSWNPGGLGQIEHIEVSLVGSYYNFSRLEPAINFINTSIGSAYHTGDSMSGDFASISIPLRPFKSTDFKVVLQYSYQRLINFNIESNTNAISFQHLITNYSTYPPQLWVEEGYQFRAEEYEGGLDSHSLSIGARVTSWLNLGVTFNFWTNGFTGAQYEEDAFNLTNLLTGQSFSGVRQEVTDNSRNFRGTSVNVGALIHVTDDFNVGLVYKNDFTFKDKNADGSDRGEVNYPRSAGIGLAYRPADNFTLAADFTQTNWSESWARYGENKTYFPKMDLPYYENVPGDVEEFKDQYQHDSFQLRLGGEYVVITPDLLVPLRAGVYFDRQYFADANNSLPIYLGVTAGAGIVWKSIVLDFALVYVSAQYQTGYFSTGNSDFQFIKGIASLIIRL